MFVELTEINWFDLKWFKSTWFEPGLMWFDPMWFKITEFLCPTFQLQNYSCAQHFWNAVAFRIFTFAFNCEMPRQSPLENIWCPSDIFEDLESLPPDPGNLWSYDSNGSWWAHTNSVIAILPETRYSNFSTTLQTYKWDVLITVYPSINRTYHLVRMNENMYPKRSSYCDLFIPYSHNQ